jgi:hypothetical protein
MHRVTGTFTPNSEVDAIAWVRPAEALLRLTHEHDRQLLTDAIEQLAGVLDRREDAEALSLG